MSKEYTFMRVSGWYQIELGNDDEAIQNALSNPGTLKVIKDGLTIWRFCPKHNSGGGPCYCVGQGPNDNAA